MTVTRTFFGIPIEGDISFADKKTQQRPIEELQPLMQVVLDDPTIEWFGWRQYTPYFNDGEPCVFSVRAALAVKLAAEAQQDDIIKCPHCGKDRNAIHVFCPYCGFRHGEFSSSDQEDHDDVMWDGVEYSGILGKRENHWDSRARKYEEGTYEGTDEARYDRCLALEKALDSGAFDDVLLAHFGDHATIIVRKDRISVESYDHD